MATQAPTLTQILDKFQLHHHPEGGFFAETYRSEVSVQTPYGNRKCSTAIHYLITEGSQSRLHRLQMDEVWHFYLGGGLCIVEISNDGVLRKTSLGADLMGGDELQHVVPAGVWFGCYPNEGTEYSLVGCTVSPGFEFADLEMGIREELIASFPQHEAEIVRLMR